MSKIINFPIPYEFNQWTEEEQIIELINLALHECKEDINLIFANGKEQEFDELLSSFVTVFLINFLDLFTKEQVISLIVKDNVSYLKNHIRELTISLSNNLIRHYLGIEM